MMNRFQWRLRRVGSLRDWLVMTAMWVGASALLYGFWWGGGGNHHDPRVMLAAALGPPVALSVLLFPKFLPDYIRAQVRHRRLLREASGGVRVSEVRADKLVDRSSVVLNAKVVSESGRASKPLDISVTVATPTPALLSAWREQWFGDGFGQLPTGFRMGGVRNTYKGAAWQDVSHNFWNVEIRGNGYWTTTGGWGYALVNPDPGTSALVAEIANARMVVLPVNADDIATYHASSGLDLVRAKPPTLRLRRTANALPLYVGLTFRDARRLPVARCLVGILGIPADPGYEFMVIRSTTEVFDPTRTDLETLRAHMRGRVDKADNPVFASFPWD